ncbi:histone [candidate division MSBL1 archaeon SCGC-AAA261D19]|uniref:Histone n=1 Tax=candidate division MSBL1 archaeon SCGC-AAA261D19 TaxID=1698273 RepID=A0A133V8K5_9EURY|nr:histone [candidate division MSBL1 archaeon SCGC-AAA261D19]
MTELPIAAVDRIIRKSGAERVSESAAVMLSEVLEEQALKIASEAAKLAKHAGRKTVRDEDVRLASRRSSIL